MNSKIKKSGILALFFSILAAILIFLLRNINVAPVGEFGSIVGLSSINEFFYNLFGFNAFWYKLTGYPGMLIDLLVALIFSCVGLKQWIKRKSIFKVDKSLFILAGTYIISLITYILFEKFAINCRPIMLPSEKILEPSFPSSHTMWVIIVMGAAIIECDRLIKNTRTKKIINILLGFVILITIVGRMVSGVHWFTDILGGVFIGSALLALHHMIVNIVNIKYKQTHI